MGANPCAYARARWLVHGYLLTHVLRSCRNASAASCYTSTYFSSIDRRYLPHTKNTTQALGAGIAAPPVDAPLPCRGCLSAGTRLPATALLHVGWPAAFTTATRGNFRRRQLAVLLDKTDLGFRERNANAAPRREKYASSKNPKNPKIRACAFFKPVNPGGLVFGF